MMTKNTAKSMREAADKIQLEPLQYMNISDKTRELCLSNVHDCIAKVANRGCYRIDNYDVIFQLNAKTLMKVEDMQHTFDYIAETLKSEGFEVEIVSDVRAQRPDGAILVNPDEDDWCVSYRVKMDISWRNAE